MNPDAEAEIERLLPQAKHAVYTADALRAAMAWAYQDAARVCREQVDEPMSYCGEWDAKIGWIKLDVAKDCAAAIEARASLTSRGEP